MERRDLEELRRNLQEERGLAPEQAQHLLAEMRRAFPEATVTGYEDLVARMTNHPKDRHVLAAAVRAGADVIITDNRSDFPAASLAPYGIACETPDAFLSSLFELFPDAIAQILLELNAARRKPPEPIEATLERLARSVPGFAAQVRAHPRIARAVDQERAGAKRAP